MFFFFFTDQNCLCYILTRTLSIFDDQQYLIDHDVMAKPMKTPVLSNDLFFDKVEILANGKCYAEIRWNCKNLLKPAKSFRFH